ncbi:bifunctional nuclease family protein [Sphingobacteriaceae bacterium WQ 2009]|uniref:Bifunctional nuclease family protein n=1 Tax=Rhinopithecimicrobium faecis TaxID=2820698 RepID=A0A8T4HD17_9SPHI|nr:bifunctional nuclease family protein [Sphingobacteriaceae bacterium WQ 2009]
MKKIKLDIVGLSYSQTQSGAYALVLGENNGNRRLPIIIGSNEAQSIAIKIEKMTPSRPLTHDLFVNFAQAFSLQISEVLIYNLVDGVFFAKLICTDGQQTKEIDARTSDAVALAVRFEIPIYTYDFIMSSAGIIIEGNEFAFLENLDRTNVTIESNEKGEKKTSDEQIRMEPPPPKNPLISYSDVQLESELSKALEEENYETAASLRDEIARRK